MAPQLHTSTRTFKRSLLSCLSCNSCGLVRGEHSTSSRAARVSSPKTLSNILSRTSLLPHVNTFGKLIRCLIWFPPPVGVVPSMVDGRFASGCFLGLGQDFELAGQGEDLA